MADSRSRNVGILWDEADIETGDRSRQVYVGSAPHVALFIRNGGSVTMTFQIEAAGVPVRHAGMNADVDPDDGWYPYLRMDATDEDFAPVVFEVAAGENRCFDLHDFTPGRLTITVDHAAGAADGPVLAFTEHFRD
jgi:hypothetical protein